MKYQNYIIEIKSNKLEKIGLTLLLLINLIILLCYRFSYGSMTLLIISINLIFLIKMYKISKLRSTSKIYRWIFISLSLIFTLWLSSIAIIEYRVIKGINYDKYSSNYDYIIVLGAGLKNGDQVSYILKKRLDKTLEVLKYNSDASLILSGGQGSDETISEAEAMKIYLTNNGVNESMIKLENKSTSTYENIEYSMKFIEGYQNKNLKIAIITNDFHSYRAQYLAKILGIATEKISSKTMITVRLNCMIREYYAIIKSYVFD